jgi:hypothetical protein
LDLRCASAPSASRRQDDCLLRASPSGRSGDSTWTRRREVRMNRSSLQPARVRAPPAWQ